MTKFLTEDFLLQSSTARTLYHDHAAKMPIYDYHCHLPVAEIAEDEQFENLTRIWLYGDHYKWRAMRANGVAEEYITGDADDYEKFEKWAETVPYCLRNPLYHWTHMELKKPFGIKNKLLNADTAKEIYDACGEMLQTPEFSARGIMRRMNVKVVCTTDDPTDSLAEHKKIKADGFEVKVYPAWRPDKAMAAEDAAALNAWIDKLEKASGLAVTDYSSYIEAIGKRHDYFHQMGCRLSDHGLERVYSEDYTQSEIKAIFDELRIGKDIDALDQAKFKTAMMVEFAHMDDAKDWVQQIHFGPIRNTNTRMFTAVGANTGFDSMGDFDIAQPLAGLLDRLEVNGRLPKTILYNINPADNEVVATLVGNFQDGSVPGKMQFGSGWWFLDQKDGIEKQIDVLSNMGLLSRFVGMLTDSRSFLSYPRHEYFRRILCNMLGNDVEKGELPKDIKLLGRMVEDICYKNAMNYFPMETE